MTHPSTPRSPQWSLSLRFSQQEPLHPLSSPIWATCPAHLIILDFITRTILGEEYRSFSFSLCSIFHSPFTLLVYMWVKNVLVRNYRECWAAKCMPNLHSVNLCVLRDDETNVNETILRISKGSDRRSTAGSHTKLKKIVNLYQNK